MSRQPDKASPGYCRVCGRQGAVVDTRHHAGWIRRRHKCPTKSHPRWTTIQLLASRSSGEMLRVASLLRTMDVEAFLDLISNLRTALKEVKIPKED